MTTTAQATLVRKIIRIDEDRCNGCGVCIPNCPEGAIRLIDGKARLVGDLLCDGLGACLGHCPEGAISIEERPAEPYDEVQVIENIIPQGPAVVRAHLEHLRDHGETAYLAQALDVLRRRGAPHPLNDARPASFVVVQQQAAGGGCPGSRSMNLARAGEMEEAPAGTVRSQLTHWPVQLHLISPAAPAYRRAKLLLAADCVAYAVGDFHSGHLRGRALAIACPKLDAHQEIYVEKIRSLVDDAEIQDLTVMIMQVPCCTGLLRTAQASVATASRKVPVRCLVVGLQGEILREETI
jgi:ferredoxin